MADFLRIEDGVAVEAISLPAEIELAAIFPQSFVDACVPAGTAERGWVIGPDGKLAAPVELAPTAAQLTAYAAAKRFAVEVGGIRVNGAPIATDRQSQAMIGNAVAYVQASGAAAVSYKTADGFVTLTADQVRTVGLAVGAHVQACFAAEDAADAGINASPPTLTTPAGVDAAFAAVIAAAAGAAPAAPEAEPEAPAATAA